MNPTARNRMLWTIAALTTAYALFNVLLFYLSGEFGPAWFAASLIVYGVLLLLSLILLFADTEVVKREEAATVGQAAAPKPADASFAQQEVIYETPTGEAIKSTHGSRAGVRTNYFTVTPEEAAALRSVEARLDAVQGEPAPNPRNLDVTEALERRSATGMSARASRRAPSEASA